MTETKGAEDSKDPLSGWEMGVNMLFHFRNLRPGH